MNTDTDLLGQVPNPPKKNHAPRAVINRLLQGAKDHEGSAISELVKRNEESENRAHYEMDCARSLRFAAKWLEDK